MYVEWKAREELHWLATQSQASWLYEDPFLHSLQGWCLRLSCKCRAQRKGYQCPLVGLHFAGVALGSLVYNVSSAFSEVIELEDGRFLLSIILCDSQDLLHHCQQQDISWPSTFRSHNIWVKAHVSFFFVPKYLVREFPSFCSSLECRWDALVIGLHCTDHCYAMTK